MRKLATVLFVALLFTTGAFAKGAPHGRSHLRSSGAGSYGTGSKSSSTGVHGYTTRRGTHVNSYRRTTPDQTQKNNYSTKGNINPYTGKTGTRYATK